MIGDGDQPPPCSADSSIRSATVFMIAAVGDGEGERASGELVRANGRVIERVGAFNGFRAGLDSGAVAL
jgi:hypothetical protein